MIQVATEIEPHKFKLLEQHPFAKITPAYSQEEKEDLFNSINEFGQHVNGLVYQGKVLDGMHRQEGCYRAGVAFKYDFFHGNDEEAKNEVIIRMKHRNLTKGQIYACACKWIDENKGSKKIGSMTYNKRKSELEALGQKYIPLSKKERDENTVTRRAATLFGVAKTTLGKALVVKRASPHLFEMIVNGRMKVDTAYNQFKQESGPRIRSNQIPVLMRLEEFKEKLQVPNVFASDHEIREFNDRMCRLGWIGEMKIKFNQELNCTQYFMNWYGNGLSSQEGRMFKIHPEPTYIRAIVVAGNDKKEHLK